MQKLLILPLLLTLPKTCLSQSLPPTALTLYQSTPPTPSMPSDDFSQKKEITAIIIWVALIFLAFVCFLCHWVTHKIKSNRVRDVVVNPLPPPPPENALAEEPFGL